MTPPEPRTTRGFALLAPNLVYGAGPKKPPPTPLVSKPHDFLGLGSEVGIFGFRRKSCEPCRMKFRCSEFYGRQPVVNTFSLLAIRSRRTSRNFLLAALLHHFYEMTKTQWIRCVPAGTHQDGIDGKTHPFGIERD